MKIILLSGGSGKRLWPLSNDARSKQFLKVLKSPKGTKESMIQRVVRQINTVSLTDDITIATGANQKEAIDIQLGDSISVVTEPCRRDTFPAIMLATAFLARKNTPKDEPVIVMPCDSFTDDGYFTAIGRMAEAVKEGSADMVLMGIEPTYPSAKYGYIVPDRGSIKDGVMPVMRFTEKPDESTAGLLISQGALWNGGVFAFRLGYLLDIARPIMESMNLGCDDDRDMYETMLENYVMMPKISFDYAVVEKAKSIAVVTYAGRWKDLGTWNVLTEELSDSINGNVVAEQCEESYMINELSIPMVCIGADNMVIAATPDGILVADRDKSERLKDLVGIDRIPMCERRTWGEYRVIDSVECGNGLNSQTSRLTIDSGKCYFPETTEDAKTWTIIDGEGEITIGTDSHPIIRGMSITLKKDSKYTIKSKTTLTLIEVKWSQLF